MAALEKTWRPQAMVESETKGEAPSGFSFVRLVRPKMSMEILEPVKLESSEDWKSITSELDHWGHVPKEDGNISIMSLLEDERGLIAKIDYDGNKWLAEFLPWGSDGKIQSRTQNSPVEMDVPCGGYSWNGIDLIILREIREYSEPISVKLSKALGENNLKDATDILYNSGKYLGKYHSSVESARITPMDQKRWNVRLAVLEEIIKTNTIWRAPFTSDTPCILSLGNIRFNDISIKNNTYSLRVGPPRLADCLLKPDCEFPAIRDFACLTHDLAQLHYTNKSNLDITKLRHSLIEGWSSTAPSKWCSFNAFYAHRGGLVVWEYEQSLLDILESISNQSELPHPAIDIITKVIPFQKKMYNNRFTAAISFMSIFVGFSTILQQIPSSLGDLIVPAICFTIGYGTFLLYRNSSPLPENPITHL